MQRFLADLIWQQDSIEDLHKFIHTLPTPEFRRDAQLVVDMITLAVLDQDITKAEDVCDAVEVLSKFRLN